jgi:DNA-binding CsgD family transcriptional regulator
MTFGPVAAEVIGRDEELATVDRFLEGALPGALVIEGGAGLGKTTLWYAGIEKAKQLGYRVLGARPAAVETSLSLAGLGDLLADVPQEARDDLPQAQRHALAVALAEEDAGPARMDGSVLGVAVLGVVRALARDGRLLLAVDDLQWLDEATGAVLVYALRRLGPADVRLLTACRSDHRALPFGLQQALDQRPVARLPLEPLTEGGIRRLLRVRLGLELSRVEMHALHEAVEGNPFYALELGRAGFELDDDGAISLPADLEDVVAARLRLLPAPTRDGLVYVAALAHPSEGRLELAGIWAQLRPAFDTDVLEQHGARVRFAHPLLRSAVWSGADHRRRCAVHLALADVAADVEERALHLAAAKDPPDPEVSAQLEEAAARALARGAPTAAAELLDRARHFTPDGDLERWAALAAEAAAAHADAGRWDVVGELVEQAQALLPPGPARAAVLLTEAQMRPGLEHALGQAVAEAGETPTGVRARLGLALQLGLVGRWEEAVRASRSATGLARRLDERLMLGLALVWLGTFKLIDSQLDGWQELDEALAIEQALGPLPTTVFHRPRTRRGTALLWADDLERACPLLEESLATALEHGDEVSAVQCMAYLALADLAAGDWASARAVARAAQELADNLGYGYGSTIVRGALAAVAAGEGDLGEARRLATETVAALEADGDRYWSTYALRTLVYVELCAGDAEAAIGHADAIDARFPGRECWWSHHQADEIEALVVAGRIDRARARIEALRRAATAYDLPRFAAWAERGAGLVQAAEGDLAAARLSLEAARRLHERFSLPLERARTELAYGSVLRRTRHRKEARAVLGEALAAFERLGARHFAVATRAELQHVGGRPPAGEHELTGAEERTALLVAQGLSNKEVAAQLCVTVSTVEATLTRVYRKLGVTSRNQLAGALARDDEG